MSGNRGNPKPKVLAGEFVDWLSRMRADVYEMSFRADGGSMQLRTIYDLLYWLEMDFRGAVKMAGQPHLLPEFVPYEAEISAAYETAA